LLLNTDAFVSANTINKTIKYMEENSGCGILGVKLVGHDGVLQPSCRYFPSPWSIFLKSTGLQWFFKAVQLVDDMGWEHDVTRKCDWVPGCYYLIRRELIDQVGLFDPRYFLYYEEVDHCFAAKKVGWGVHFFPDTTVVHVGGESAKSEGSLTSSGRQLAALQIESELLYFQKNYGGLKVLIHVLLLTLADMINFFKTLVKLKERHVLRGYFKHSFLVWSLYFKTRLATVPTR
jgi:N-acetylglucosaminyl-diphospho-decaprenol L-rhamnosyltransferase